MTLNDCTKAELRSIIDRLMVSSSVAFQVERQLIDLEFARNERKYRQGDEILKRSREKLSEYTQLVAPYEGRPLRNMPDGVLQRACELLRDHEAADAEWRKLMGIKIDRPRKRSVRPLLPEEDI